MFARRGAASTDRASSVTLVLDCPTSGCAVIQGLGQDRLNSAQVQNPSIMQKPGPRNGDRATQTAFDAEVNITSEGSKSPCGKHPPDGRFFLA